MSAVPHREFAETTQGTAHTEAGARIVDSVRARLIQSIDRLEAARGEAPRDLWRKALALEHLAMGDLLSRCDEDAVLAHPIVTPLLRRSQAIFSALESEIEKSMADLVKLAGADPLWPRERLGQHYVARYEELAAKEIELAAMRASDRVLFIGSGYLPITAFEYSRQAGCEVDCVDFVEEAVTCARDCAERLGLSGRVRSWCIRGEHHDASRYDVILVGVLAAPKQTILSHLDSTAKSGCRIVCRTTVGLRQLIYPRAEFEESKLSRLRCVGESVAQGDRVISAQLLHAA